MPTLRAIRERLLAELGPYGILVATTAGTTGYVEVASSPIKSTSLQSRRFEGYHLFRPDLAPGSLDRDRIVKVPGGYDPSLGRLTPDNPWATAIGAAERAELIRLLGGTQLNRLINEGLHDCLTVAEFTVTPSATEVRRTSLTAAAPWLKNESDVLRIGWLPPNAAVWEDPYSYPRRVRFQKVGATIYIVGGHIPTDGTLYVEAVKEHYHHCRPAAGVYGDQSGLSLETDETEADEAWVASAALRAAWNRYKTVLDPAANQKTLRSQFDAAEWFTYQTAQNFQPPVPEVRPPPKAFGPRWR
jgi:hypothetical protein